MKSLGDVIQMYLDNKTGYEYNRKQGKLSQNPFVSKVYILGKMPFKIPEEPDNIAPY